jgi:LysM repeat protein
MWTKSACVLLALSIALIMTAAAGLTDSARPVQANTRNANSTEQIIVTSELAAGTPFTTTAHTAGKKTAAHTVRYVVRPGDTLSGIATRFGLRGGWQALYAANRAVVGPDPNIIDTGTVLALSEPVVPAHYQVAAGDTLSGVAARFGLPGGWQALYAANRAAIGSDPDVIRTGTVLTIPGRAPGRTPAPHTTHPGHRGHRQPPPTAHPGQRVHQPAPTARPGHRSHQPPPSGNKRALAPVPTPAGTREPTVTGMPAWLRAVLLAVAVLIGGAFLLQLAMAVVGRRHRKAAAVQPIQVRPAPAVREPASGRPAEHRAGIVLADHERLIVTHSRADDTIYVLRPPGEDPAAIMRVARLVLAEASYRDLAEYLGLPASWPIILADYHRLVVTHSAADNTVCVLRPPGEDPMAVLRAARLVLQEEPYEELASQLGVPASWPLE